MLKVEGHLARHALQQQGQIQQALLGVVGVHLDELFGAEIYVDMRR